MKLRPRKWVSLPTDRKVPIVGDAAIASGRIADGRLVPLLIVDTTNHADLEELIRVHNHLPPGDVEFQWATSEGADEKVSLVLSFKRPIDTMAILEFDILKQGGLVDQILTTRIFYLQAGREGDRFVTNPDAPKIFVEIKHTGFEEIWDDLFHRRVAKHMRETGLRRWQAKDAARQYIKKWREFGQLRMPSS